MTKLCPRGKAAAKRKFKVYPSAYANAYASKICAGKIKDPSGVKRKDFRGPKPAKRGAMIKADKGTLATIKDKIGPIQVSPTVTKQQSVEGKVKSDVTSGGVGVAGKFGSLNLRKTKTTESAKGFKDYETKEKSVSYEKRFKTGKNSYLDLTLNKGKSKSNTGFKTDTKGGTITFTKQFSTGGYNGSYIKGEIGGKKVSNKSLVNYYKGMVDE